MKTLVVGAGAIGATVAALCANDKLDISLLVRSELTCDKINQNGLILHGAKGEVKADLPCYTTETMPNVNFDVVFIATKFQQMHDAAVSILPYLHETSFVVGMQNGICTDKLCDVVGENRAVGCMIGYGATRNSANEFTMTSLGEFYIGQLGENSEKLPQLQQLLNHVLPTKISTDITLEQYSKLIINSCINAVAALTGKTLGEILDDKRARDLFLEIAREGMFVAQKMNIKVPKYGAILDYRLLTFSNNKLYNSLCKAIVWLVGKTKYSSVKPSTLQSLEKGELTEIDIFNGYFVQQAKRLNIKVKTNEKIVRLIHEIERGERKISPYNLNEF